MRKYLAAAFLLLSAAHVDAVDFDFSFTNVVGNVAGTVTGHIDGLVDNATSAATAIYITSYPSSLGLDATPFNVFDWAGFNALENSFTVSNGVLTGGAFSAKAGIHSKQLYLNSGCCDTAATNFFNIDGDDRLYVWNNGALNAADGLVIAGQSAAPEIASWAMMVTGFGLVGGALRGRSRPQPAIA